MSEQSPSQYPRTELATRAEWITQMKKDRNYTHDDLTFGYPQTIHNLDARGIATGLQGAALRAGDEVPADLRVLQLSPLWDKLASHESVSDEDINLLSQDKFVATFLAHSRASEQVAQDIISEKFAATVATFHEGIMEGRRLGYMPDKVSPATIEALFKNVMIKVFDEFYSPDAAGLYNENYDEIGIMAGIGADETQKTLVHELRHRLAGGTFRKSTQPDGQVDIERVRTGFQQRGRHVALDEAVNEHVTLAILGGDWDVINPLERKDQGAYQLERRLLHEFIKKSQGLISLKAIVRGSFEDTEPHVDFNERRQMVREVRSAYNDGTLSRYDELSQYLGQGLDYETIAHAIQGPKVVKGRVLAKGFIDINFVEREQELLVA